MLLSLGGLARGERHCGVGLEQTPGRPQSDPGEKAGSGPKEVAIG